MLYKAIEIRRCLDKKLEEVNLEKKRSRMKYLKYQ